MKKILFGILLLPLVTFADNSCMPNLINEDMCLAAKKFADNGNKSVPVSISERVKINKFRAEKRRVIITANLDYDKKTLEDLYDNDPYFYDKARKLSRKVTIESICSDKNIKAFTNLGGEIEYEYFFSDGAIYDIMTVTACY
ncbi:hypothetical protein [Morganella morganii]|uniref:hypothetical protein n=1 Tax=Morganella morganii TaxID=582 RepID=UPI0032DA4D55